MSGRVLVLFPWQWPLSFFKPPFLVSSPASRVSCAYLQEVCGKPVWWCGLSVYMLQNFYMYCIFSPSFVVFLNSLENLVEFSLVDALWPSPSFGFGLVGCPVPSALFDGFVRITILKALPIRPHLCFCCNSDDQTSMSLLTFITWLICRKNLLYCWKLHIYNTHMLIFFTSLLCSQHVLCSLLNGHQNAKE